VFHRYLGTIVAAAVAAVVLFAVLATADGVGYERAGVAAGHALAGLAFFAIQAIFARDVVDLRRWLPSAAVVWTLLSLALALAYATGWHPGGNQSLFPGYRELGSMVVLLAAFGAISGPFLARSLRQPPAPDRRTAWFHEDLFGQLELLPVENLDWCLGETRRIAEFSAAHRAEIGWTDIYLRPPAPVPLSTRGITAAALRDAVAPHAPPYDAVTTGYSTHVEEARNVAAYGSAAHLTLFAAQRDGIVSDVFFILGPRDAEEVARATAMLAALSQWSLLLVDWDSLDVMRLEDADALRAYLSQHVSE
jgi:hypothetical protein